MSDGMEYRKVADGWMAWCPYCDTSEVFDTPGRAVEVGLRHIGRCRANHTT